MPLFTVLGALSGARVPTLPCFFDPRVWVHGLDAANERAAEDEVRARFGDLLVVWGAARDPHGRSRSQSQGAVVRFNGVHGRPVDEFEHDLRVACGCVGPPAFACVSAEACKWRARPLDEERILSITRKVAGATDTAPEWHESAARATALLSSVPAVGTSDERAHALRACDLIYRQTPAPLRRSGGKVTGRLFAWRCACCARVAFSSWRPDATVRPLYCLVTVCRALGPVSSRSARDLLAPWPVVALHVADGCEGFLPTAELLKVPFPEHAWPQPPRPLPGAFGAAGTSRRSDQHLRRRAADDLATEFDAAWAAAVGSFAMRAPRVYAPEFDVFRLADDLHGGSSGARLVARGELACREALWRAALDAHSEQRSGAPPLLVHSNDGADRAGEDVVVGCHPFGHAVHAASGLDLDLFAAEPGGVPRVSCDGDGGGGVSAYVWLARQAAERAAPVPTPPDCAQVIPSTRECAVLAGELTRMGAAVPPLAVCAVGGRPRVEPALRHCYDLLWEAGHRALEPPAALALKRELLDATFAAVPDKDEGGEEHEGGEADEADEEGRAGPAKRLTVDEVVDMLHPRREADLAEACAGAGLPRVVRAVVALLRSACALDDLVPDGERLAELPDYEAFEALAASTDTAARARAAERMPETAPALLVVMVLAGCEDANWLATDASAQLFRHQADLLPHLYRKSTSAERAWRALWCVRSHEAVLSVPFVEGAVRAVLAAGLRAQPVWAGDIERAALLSRASRSRAARKKALASALRFHDQPRAVEFAHPHTTGAVDEELDMESRAVSWCLVAYAS